MAHADNTYTYNSAASNSDDSHKSGNQLGMTFGAGVEMALNARTSMKFEYLHVGLNTIRTTRVNGDSSHFGNSLDTMRVGANFKF